MMSYRIKRIVSLANNVYKGLGPGHSEYVYQRGLEMEFRTSKIMYQTNVCIPIMYDHYVLSHGHLDMMVEYEDEYIPIELKALVNEPRINDVIQLRNYLIHQKEIDYGLLINFPQPSRTKQSSRTDIDAMLVPKREDDDDLIYIDVYGLELMDNTKDN